MFILHLVNGYRIASPHGSWNYIETERFFLEFEDANPLVSKVMTAVREHYEPKDRYNMNPYRYLTTENDELKVDDWGDVDVRITKYGIKSGDLLYVASTMR